MSWEDVLAPPSRLTGAPPRLPTLVPPRPPSYTSPLPALGGGSDSLGIGVPGRLANPVRTPPTAPETFRATMPFSTQAPGVAAADPRPATDTQGDILGSVGAALGDFFATNDLTTAAPSIYEAPASIFYALGQAFPGNPVTGFGEAIFGSALPLIEGASNTLGPIMQAPVIAWRDEENRNRVASYRALVSGQMTSPEMIFMLGDPVERLRKLIAAVTGTDEETQRKITMDTFDLPDAVKDALNNDPNVSDTDLEKLFDEAGGKRFTYSSAPEAILQNMVPELAVYVAEYAALRGSLAKLRGLGMASTIPGVTAATRAGTTLTSLAIKGNTLAIKAGATAMFATTTMNAIARHAGNQAALDFTNVAFNYEPISMNPNVQLVTGFTVNPFAAVSFAKRNILRLGDGTNVVISKVFGRELMNDTDKALDYFAYIHGIPRASVRDKIAEFGISEGEAKEIVFEYGLQHVVNRLPPEVRMALQRSHSDGVTRTENAFRQYEPAIWDAIEKKTDELRLMVVEDFHAYNNHVGPYDPDRALASRVDYRLAKLLTYKIRDQEKTLAVGFPNLLIPQASQAIREGIEGLDRIPVSQIDDFIDQYSALGKYTGPLKPKVSGGSIAREDFESALALAERDFNVHAKRNPVHAKTGADPILRPDATMREWADAFDTDPTTIYVARTPSKNVARDAEILRPFLSTKKEVLEFTDERIAAMSDEEVIFWANAHVSDVSEPWVRAGERLATAEGALKRLRVELAEEMKVATRGSGARVRAEKSPRLDHLTKQVRDLEELVRAASDQPNPFQPFSAVLAGAKRPTAKQVSEAALERAYRYVDAHRRLDDIDAVTTGLGRFFHDPWDALGKVHKNREGGWVYAGGASTFPESLRKKMLRHFGNSSEARQFSTESDNATMWAALRQNLSSVKLTARERALFNRHVAGTEDISDAMKAGDPTEAFDALVKARDAIDDLLAKSPFARTLSGLRRDSKLRPNVNHIEEIEARLADEQLGFDYVAEEQLPDRISEILTALDNPDNPGGLAVAAELIESTPQLWSQLAKALYGNAIDHFDEMDAFLRDPTNVDTIRALLPDPLRKTTPLDEALLAAMSSGDTGAMDAALGQVRIQKGGLVKQQAPIKNVSPKVAARLMGASGIVADPSPEFLAAQAKLDEVGARLRAYDDAKLARRERFEAAIAEVLQGRPALHPDTGRAIDIGTTKAQHRKAASALRKDRIEKFGDDFTDAKGRKQSVKDPVLTALRAEQTAARAEVTRLKPKVIERLSTRRRSVTRELTAKLKRSQADLTAMPDPDIMARNAVGAEVMSLVGWGVPGRYPNTLREVLDILEEIESGRAAGLGFGPRSLAEGQRLAESLLGKAAREATEAAIPAGVMSKGAFFGDLGHEAQDELKRMIDEGLVAQDPSAPFGLKYGLKELPENQFVDEIEMMRERADQLGIPSLAEEMWTGHFAPYYERIGAARTRQLFNAVFGPEGPLGMLNPRERANSTIYREARARFTQRTAMRGVAPEDADAVWKAWSDYAENSNLPKFLQISGEWRKQRGDVSLVMSPANIPGSKLREVAMDATGNRYPRVDWAREFFEANSLIMRKLADDPWQPFGRKLEAVYGRVFKNDAVRFWYYIFRFAGDVRYHALNYFEGAFLYAGRAGLRQGGVDEGLLGYTREKLTRIAGDPAADTGYPFSVSRASWADRVFRKEQPDELMGELKRIKNKDPETLAQAFREMAEFDPELSKTIAAMGDTPESWLVAMDDWYKRVLNRVDPAEEVDEQIAALLATEPALQEVYGRLSQVNRELWDNVKATMFGNPNRSQLERTLNHYLLYWPLSYQIKSTKWLLRVMFDRLGGLPTNSFGAYAVDKLAGEHHRMLREDPEYARWIKDNPTLMFTAQMLMPANPGDLGVSMSPMVRNAFFPESARRAFEIGPIYTISRFLPALSGELYRNMHDVPGMDFLYRTLHGGQAPNVVTGRAVRPQAPATVSEPVNLFR